MKVSVKACQGNPGGAALARALSEYSGDVQQWVQDSGRIVKDSENVLAAIVQINGEAFFVKLYRYKSAWRRLVPALGLRRPVIAYEMGRKMYAAGLPVPLPLACFRLHQGIVVMTEAIPAGQSLAVARQTFNEQHAQQHNRLEQEKLLNTVAGAIADMHSAGYSHGDCKWSNLLLSDTACFVVDLDAARTASVHSRAQARDLARFTIDAEELGLAPALYANFFEAYTNAVDLEQESARQELKARMQPYLNKFRRRHLARYGRTSSPLL